MPAIFWNLLPILRKQLRKYRRVRVPLSAKHVRRTRTQCLLLLNHLICCTHSHASPKSYKLNVTKKKKSKHRSSLRARRAIGEGDGYQAFAVNTRTIAGIGTSACYETMPIRVDVPSAANTCALDPLLPGNCGSDSEDSDCVVVDTTPVDSLRGVLGCTTQQFDCSDFPDPIESDWPLGAPIRNTGEDEACIGEFKWRRSSTANTPTCLQSGELELTWNYTRYTYKFVEATFPSKFRSTNVGNKCGPLCL